MQRELLCPVCNNSYKDPVILRCKHNICSGCLAALEHNGKISCPSCSTFTYKADNALPINHCLQLIVDEGVEGQDIFFRSSTSMKVCGVCEEAVATKHCIQCDGFLCLSCVETNHGKDFFKNHVVRDIEETRPTRSERNCSIHREEKVDFYCIDCGVPVCSHCLLLGDHQEHAQMPIAKAVEERQQVMVAQVDKLKQRRDSSQELLNELKETEKKVAQGGEQQRASLNKAMSQLIELIESKRHQLLAKSSLEEEQKRAQVRVQMEKTRAVLMQFEGELERMEMLRDVAIDHDFLTLGQPIVQDAKRVAALVVETFPPVPTVYRTLDTDVQFHVLSEMDLQDSRKVTRDEDPRYASPSRAHPTSAVPPSTVAAAQAARTVNSTGKAKVQAQSVLVAPTPTANSTAREPRDVAVPSYSRVRSPNPRPMSMRMPADSPTQPASPAGSQVLLRVARA